MKLYEETQELNAIRSILSGCGESELKEIKYHFDPMIRGIIREKIEKRKQDEKKEIEIAISEIYPGAKTVKIISFDPQRTKIWATESIVTTEWDGSWDCLTFTDTDADVLRDVNLKRFHTQESIDLGKYSTVRSNIKGPLLFLNQIKVCPYCGERRVDNWDTEPHPYFGYDEYENTNKDDVLSFLRNAKTSGLFNSSHAYTRCRECAGKTRLKAMEDVVKKMGGFGGTRDKIIARIHEIKKTTPPISEEKIERIKNKRRKGMVKQTEPEVESFTPETEPKQKSLYLMKDKELGLYKIGMSNNPKHRERTLMAQKPSIEMVGSWGDLGDHEREWHMHFEKERVRGEWFKLTPAQVRFFVHRCVSNTGPEIVTA